MLAIERPVQLCLFDWDKLDAKTRNKVQESDAEFKACIQECYASYVKACIALKKTHDALKNKRPGFKNYCDSVGLNYTDAQAMVNHGGLYETIPSIAEIPCTKTALNWLTKQPEDKQLKVVQGLESDYQLEANENKEYSKKNLLEFQKRAEDIEKSLKSLKVGDYVKVDGKTGKIITLNKETCFVDFLDGINPKSHQFDKIQSVLCPQWQEMDVATILGGLLEVYRGWEISSFSYGISINNTKTAYSFSLEGIEIDNQDWCVLQAIKEIDRLEKENPRPKTVDFWGFADKLGQFICKDSNDNEIFLIKDENGLIGCQIQLRENYSTLKVGEFGFNLSDWPQTQRDPDWWIEEAKEEGKRCDFSDDEDEDFNEPHPDYTGGKWKPEDWVEAKGDIGKIKSLHPRGAIVIFADKNELIPYDFLQKHIRPEPIPESQINLIPVEIINRVKEVLGGYKVIKTISEDWGKEGKTLLVIPPHEQTVDFLKKIETSHSDDALYEAIAIFPIDINSILAIDSGNICYLSNPIDDTYYLVWYLGIYPDTFAKFFEDLGTIWDKH